MKTLTTPISVPNIRKWQVTRFNAYLDDAPAWGEMTIQIFGAGSVPYCVRVLPIFDAQPSMTILANPTPVGYTDAISTAMKTIVNAFTTLQTANVSAGNRAAQLAAIETAALSIGIVDASLAGT